MGKPRVTEPPAATPPQKRRREEGEETEAELEMRLKKACAELEEMKKKLESSGALGSDGLKPKENDTWTMDFMSRSLIFWHSASSTCLVFSKGWLKNLALVF